MDVRWVGAAVLLTFGSGELLASGFAIREQSGSFQGLSFAGVAAGGADISTLYFNPATIARHDGNEAHLSVSYIVPRAEFSFDGGTDRFGGALTGGEAGNIATNAIVPATYAMLSLDDIRFGLGITAPFGLRTEQPNDWVGRYHATESDLKTININPVVAYRVSDRFAVAAGFVAQYADATLGQAVAVAPGTDGQAEIKGNDWDYGFTLGLVGEPLPGTEIGLGYRSQINHTLTGDFKLTVGGATQQETSGRAALSTPQIASLGVRQAVTDDIDVLGTIEWTGWSSFDELRISFDDGSPDSLTPENWRDTWFFALGSEYRPNEDWTLQAGVAFDQSPIRDGFRTPRIPGSDRTWLSIGAAWKPADWISVGAGYSRIFVADGDVDLTDPGRGDLRGTFENDIDILTLHGTIRF